MDNFLNVFFNIIYLFIRIIQVLIIEFNNRDQDFVSVSELCSIVQQSPDACPFVDDLTKLLDSSEAFKTRWTETHNKSRMFKAYIENRIAIYKEWKNDLRLLDTWLEINEKVCNSNKTFFSTVARVTFVCLFVCFGSHFILSRIQRLSEIKKKRKKNVC